MKLGVIGITAIAVAGLCSAPCFAAAQAYAVFISGRPAGQMTVDAAPGLRTVTYDYADRGRGPSLKSLIRLDGAGKISAITVDGVNYYKGPVAERFEKTGATARWKSAVDEGSGGQDALYLPFEQTPEHLAALTRELLTRQGGEGVLLPAGKVKVLRLGERRVAQGGQAKTVTLYGVQGLGYLPSLVWLDDKGELFAAGDVWQQTIRQGWEGAGPELIKAQDAAYAERLAQQARTLAQRPTGPVVLRHANLFDSVARVMRSDMAVVVQDGRIQAVGPDGEIKTPKGAQVIDAAGMSLLPGLWDMHVHLSGPEQAMMHIAGGVTGVRDLANDMDSVLEARRAYDAGELIGPHVVLGGFVESPGPYAGPTKTLVSTPQEVRDLIGLYAKNGYIQAKLYSSLKPELVPVAVEEAHRLGLAVSGHIPAGFTMEEAVRAGFDEVHHANFWILNFQPPEIAKVTNTMARHTEVGAHGGELDLDSEPVRQFIALLKARKVTLDPTMVTFERLYLAGAEASVPGGDQIVKRLPPTLRRNGLGAGLGGSPELQAKYKQAYARLEEFLFKLWQAGVPIVPGTDNYPVGFMLHRELTRYVKAGIPNTEVLYMATLGSAKVARRDADVGSIEVGKAADLVLVKGDPSKTMSDVSNTVWVMRSGVAYDPKALYEAVGVAPQS